MGDGGAAAETFSQSLIERTPGPGAYEPANALQFATAKSFMNDRPSPWALSKSHRLPSTATCGDPNAAPGEYDAASKQSLAAKTSAAASPNANAQQGFGWRTGSASRERMFRLPYHQHVVNDGPGPGHYHSAKLPHTIACATSGEDAVRGTARGLGGVGFRSTTPQHGPPLASSQATPPPGAYDVEPGWLNTSRSGDFSRVLFASKADRFGPTPQTTDHNVGPGSYSPESGERQAQERFQAGKDGACVSLGTP